MILKRHNLGEGNQYILNIREYSKVKYLFDIVKLLKDCAKKPKYLLTTDQNSYFPKTCGLPNPIDKWGIRV